jgi:hypothetical protein
MARSELPMARSELPKAQSERQRRISRRRLLAAGSAMGVSLVSGLVGVVRFGGYELTPSRPLAALSTWQFVVVKHAAARITASDREGDASIPSADEVDVAGFVDDWLGRADASLRRDMRRFLGFLEHLAPFGSGFATRFTRLHPADQDLVLASLERSHSDLLSAGFDGLKALVFMGFYRDARTWSIAGYDGPLLGRPQRGWF